MEISCKLYNSDLTIPVPHVIVHVVHVGSQYTKQNISCFWPVALRKRTADHEVHVHVLTQNN